MRVLHVMIIMFIVAAGLDAKGVFKRYPVKSAEVLYDINTSSIGKGLNNQVGGIARLVFDNWGAREVKEEDATEVQVGDFNETRSRRSLSKIDFGTIYTVDYDENKTYKTRDTAMDIAIAKGEDQSNESINILKKMKARKVGVEKVAGYPCDVWKLKDQTLWIYKGIPLKIVVKGPGFYTSRTAVSVKFNEPIPEKEFLLPDFPIIVDDDYTSNVAAKTRTQDYIASIRDLKNKMREKGIDLESGNITITPNLEKEIVNTLGERYLKKQKRLLPKLMVALKSAKECVSKAKNGKEAEKCIEPVNKIDEELGDRTENFDYSNWNSEKQKKIVNSLQNEMNYLRVTIGCVKKFNKTTDVIQCTEGSLESKDM